MAELPLAEAVRVLSTEMGIALKAVQPTIHEEDCITAQLMHNSKPHGVIALYEPNERDNSFSYQGLHPKVQDGKFDVSFHVFTHDGKYFRKDRHDIRFLGFPQNRTRGIDVETTDAMRSVENYVTEKRS